MVSIIIVLVLIMTNQWLNIGIIRTIRSILFSEKTYIPEDENDSHDDELVKDKDPPFICARIVVIL